MPLEAVNCEYIPTLPEEVSFWHGFKHYFTSRSHCWNLRHWLVYLPEKGCKQANYVNAGNMNNTTRAKSYARKKPLFSAHRVTYFVVLDIIENW